MPTIPSAAPVASRGTMSMAIRPPRKQISTPIAMPNSTMLRTFTHNASPPYMNRISATEFSMPNIRAGICRSPLNNLSENHPDNTVPMIPSRAFIDTMDMACASEKPFASCRNNTPHPLMA